MIFQFVGENNEGVTFCRCRGSPRFFTSLKQNRLESHSWNSDYFWESVHKAKTSFETGVLDVTTMWPLIQAYAAKNEAIINIIKKVKVLTKALMLHSNTLLRNALDFQSSFDKHEMMNKRGLHSNFDGFKHIKVWYTNSVESFDLLTTSNANSLKKSPTWIEEVKLP